MRYKGKEAAPAGRERHVVALTSQELQVVRSLVSSAKRFMPRNTENLTTYSVVRELAAQLAHVGGSFKPTPVLYELPLVSRVSPDVERHQSKKSFAGILKRKTCSHCGNKIRANAERSHAQRCARQIENGRLN